jgi:NADPH-ferrihemoprotein reductase
MWPQVDLQVPLWWVYGSGVMTLVLASTLAYLLRSKPRGESSSSSSALLPAEHENGHAKGAEVSSEEYPGGQICVYFATQTGTAESFARQIEREAKAHGFYAHVVDLEDIATVEDLADPSRRSTENSGGGTEIARGIFLTATYGEGEPPDNAVSFVHGLKEKVPLDNNDDGRPNDGAAIEPCLVALDYCVFGLGNRQYDQFNAMGKLFDGALERLGGNRIAELALGDDDADLESDFETWKEKVLWPTLKARYLREGDLKVQPSAKAPEPLSCRYEVVYHPSTLSRPADPSDTPLDLVHGQSRHYFTAVECPVVGVRTLRADDDDGTAVHVEIDLSGHSRLSYETADNLGIIPENEPSVVESVASSLGLDLEQVFSLRAAPGQDWHGMPFPMPLSVRECLARYCDLTGAPRRSDLKLLAAYASDPLDRSALLRLSSKAGKAEYKEKILDGFVGMAGLLQLCPSIKMPLEHFVSVCSLTQTRFFTISSSASVHPSTVHLTVAVHKEKRKGGSDFIGLCSNYLASAFPGVAKVRAFVRASSFRLPTDCSRPIIMVGPGTGVAPMRALLQERVHQRRSLKRDVGPSILYFGCRHPSKDFLYEDELKELEREGDLAQLHVAFSRAQSEKVYVQHLLVRNAPETWDLIHQQGAYVYVCGAVKMGHEVADAFRDVFVQKGQMSADEAKAYFSDMVQAGRYVQELWS